MNWLSSVTKVIVYVLDGWGLILDEGTSSFENDEDCDSVFRSLCQYSQQ